MRGRCSGFRDVLVRVTFLFLFFCAADAVAKDEKQSFSPPIYFSQDHGTIEQVYQGNSDKLVVCIQDAHANEIAQRNIAKIVTSLRDLYGMDMVGVEGASGVVDTALYEAFPRVRAKELMTQFLVKQGKIKGAELASIESAEPLLLFGVEDPALYLENYDALVESAGVRKEALEVLRAADKQLSLARQALYSDSLKESQAAWEDFLAGKMSSRAIFTSLDTKARENGVSTKALGHWEPYRKLIALEANLDFAKVDQERAAAVSALGKVLDTPSLKELTQAALHFRLGKLSPVEFHRMLLRFMESQRMAYPALSGYMQYLEISESVRGSDLQHEMEQVDEMIFDKMAGVAEAPKKLRDLAKTVRLLDKFLRLRASRTDFSFYQRQRERMGATVLLTGIARLCEQAKVSWPSREGRAQILQKGLDKSEVFYGIALRRDKVLAANLLSEMDRGGKKAAILLAGGFHTEGVVRYFKEKGVSCVVALPKVGEQDSEDRYIALLTAKNTPYLDIYRKKKKTDVLSGSIGWILPSRYTKILATDYPDFFSDGIKAFVDRVRDLELQYGICLPSLMVALQEREPEQVVAELSRSLEKRLKSAPGPERVAAIRRDLEFLKGLFVQPRLHLPDGEVYAPVLIDSVVFVLHLYREEKEADAISAISHAKGEVSKDFALQVESVDDFARAMTAKVQVEANAKAILAGFGNMSPGMTGQTVDAMTAPFLAAIPGPFKSSVAYPPFQQFHGIGVIAYDIDKYQEEVGHLVGLAPELQKMKAQGIKVVLISNNPEVQKNLKVLGLSAGNHYDVLVNLTQAENLMAPLAEALGRESSLATWARQPEALQKALVLVTPRPDIFGPRDAKDANKIAGTPIVVPAPATDTKHAVSVPKILYFAKLVLDYQGNFQALADAIAANPAYAELRAFLEQNGIPITGDSLRDALYRPSPVEVPEDLGKEAKALCAFLKSA